MTVADLPPRVAVIGAGPAGLMAAEVLARGGAHVDVFDAMPSAGRKFLLAGKGGLNLTHSEPFEAFASRYGARRAVLEPMLKRFGPAELRDWASGLGIPTFVGSSGRVFPLDMKAAPLLRAWLSRLRSMGVGFHMRHRWTGWPPRADAATAWRFATPQGEATWSGDGAVLALGGASWPQLGSDGAWVPWLEAQGVSVAPLQPSNCGFDVARRDASGASLAGWSEFFRTRQAGAPLKTVAIKVRSDDGHPGDRQPMAASPFCRQGEFVVTGTGIEGSLVYAAASQMRDAIAAHGRCVIEIDLLPDRSAAFVLGEVARPRGARSLSTHLKSRLGIDGVKAALLHELLPREALANAATLAAALKALPLTLTAPRPVGEAISSAGGVRFESLRHSTLIREVGRGLGVVACAGEMLDWEAPTGGYLLTACFASGVRAAEVLLSTWSATTPLQSS